MGRVATQTEIEGKNAISIPLTLGDPDMEDPNFDLIGDGDGDDEDPQISALMEKIESMEVSNLKDKEFLQNTILEMSQRPAQVVTAQTAAPVAAADLNLDDLPDPVEKSAEFTAELGKRVKAYVNQQNDNTTAAVTAQNTAQAGVADLENRFNRDYKTLAEKPGVFQAVVSQEVQKLKNRGLNPQQFIFADPDKFLAKVATQMKAELGIEDDEEDEDLDDDQVSVKKISKLKKSRTKGVKAGSMPNLKKGGKETGKKPLSFVKELKKRQLEMGLI